MLMKFKWVLLFLLTKAKVLLIGLTQAKTFLSMAIALGVYATIYGWQFALGLVVSIYIHEMGHVVWLRRYGIPATAPMFIPGLGAFVRLKAHPATAGEDARVGLAGPVWGAVAAVLALALGVAFGRPILFAIARVGALDQRLQPAAGVAAGRRPRFRGAVAPSARDRGGGRVGARARGRRQHVLPGRDRGDVPRGVDRQDVDGRGVGGRGARTRRQQHFPHVRRLAGRAGGDHGRGREDLKGWDRFFVRRGPE